jgi:protein involved in polysaccharide export with SLBB domain
MQRQTQGVKEAEEAGIGEGFTQNEDLDHVILAPGDAIEVKFYYTPELDVNQVIRPDGYISMLLVGEVKAAGKTPSDLGADITTRYAWHLKNPQISVIVRSLYNRRVYVGGFVVKPGVVPMPGPMTLSEAIVEVGGFNEDLAKSENIIVVRNKGGQRKIFKVNMRKAMKDIDAEPFNLLPKDIVYVPQTRIAQADQWVDQHLNRLIPQFVYIAWYPFGNPYR